MSYTVSPKNNRVRKSNTLTVMTTTIHNAIAPATTQPSRINNASRICTIPRMIALSGYPQQRTDTEAATATNQPQQ